MGAPPTDSIDIAYVLHGVGFFIVLVSLIAACFVFTRRFAVAGDRPWAIICATVGVALPVIYALSGVLSRGGADPQPLSLMLRLLAVTGWSWASLLAAHLLKQTRTTPREPTQPPSATREPDQPPAATREPDLQPTATSEPGPFPSATS
ncbi:DUF998 domain-containing protein [Nonomuraea sp. NPDC050663]|uniref:DUF998 domain-containing protein n=1 Tax=Nonomuraea sp. NPDC050663 TaxID=3364370 RepID=UPI0037BD8EF1